MTHCNNCGQPVTGNEAFCPSCGAPIAQAQAPPQQAPPPPGGQGYQGQAPYQQAPPPPQGQGYQGQAPYQQPPSGAPAFLATADTTGQYDPQDIQQNKAMAILAYIGLLVLVPIFAAKESRFARFHSNQGLILFIVDVALGILIAVLSAIFLAISWRLVFISTILNLLWLPMLGLHILGIVNAANGHAKELPLIGKFKLIK